MNGAFKDRSTSNQRIEDTLEVKKPLSNRQSYVEIPLPKNFVKFDLEKDQLMFSTIGLYGTNKEQSYYKIIVTFGGK